MFSPTAEQEQRGTGATMPVKIHYTPKGARYANWSNATPLEELELYRQRSAPKRGSCAIARMLEAPAQYCWS